MSNLSEMRVVSLKKLAKSKGIKGYSKLKKVELIKILGKSKSPKVVSLKKLAKSLSEMRVVSLKKLAKSKGIKGYSKLKKTELIKALGKSTKPVKKIVKKKIVKKKIVKKKIIEKKPKNSLSAIKRVLRNIPGMEMDLARQIHDLRGSTPSIYTKKSKYPQEFSTTMKKGWSEMALDGTAVIRERFNNIFVKPQKGIITRVGNIQTYKPFGITTKHKILWKLLLPIPLKPVPGKKSFVYDAFFTYYEFGMIDELKDFISDNFQFYIDMYKNGHPHINLLNGIVHDGFPEKSVPSNYHSIMLYELKNMNDIDNYFTKFEPFPVREGIPEPASLNIEQWVKGEPYWDYRKRLDGYRRLYGYDVVRTYRNGSFEVEPPLTHRDHEIGNNLGTGSIFTFYNYNKYVLGRDI